MPEQLTTAATGRVTEAVRPDYDSTTLQIVSRPSAEIADRVRSYLAGGNTRYYLSAGTTGFDHPLWTFRPDRPVTRTLEDELEQIDRWTGDGALAPRLVVTEVFGPPRPQDMAFWQSCLNRLSRRRVCRPRLLVLRHDDVPASGPWLTAADPVSSEILLALLLSGGYAWRSEFERWAAALGWDADRIDALTSTRDHAVETVYTYRDSLRWAQARAVGEHHQAARLLGDDRPVAFEPDLAAYRQAWRLASATGSLTGMARVAIGMVPKLIEDDGRAEAESGVLDLLRSYDATPVPPASAERAALASCWRLAEAWLADGVPRTAAGWYVKAVRRMRRPAPEVVSDIMRTLGARPHDCPEFAGAVLAEELAVHMAMATDAEALESLAGEGEHGVRR
jgi:hypothetical protein